MSTNNSQNKKKLDRYHRSTTVWLLIKKITFMCIEIHSSVDPHVPLDLTSEEFLIFRSNTFIREKTDDNLSYDNSFSGATASKIPLPELLWVKLLSSWVFKCLSVSWVQVSESQTFTYAGCCSSGKPLLHCCKFHCRSSEFNMKKVRQNVLFLQQISFVLKHTAHHNHRWECEEN